MALRRLLKVLKLIGINLLVFVAAAEVSLRILPGVIPESLLKRFEPSMRASIAERRSLPNISDAVQVERDDGGPPLLIFKSNRVVRFTSRETGLSGEIHMDDRGFCNPAGVIGPDGTVDVVATGDSFTACQNEPPGSTAPESYVNWPFVFGRMTGQRVYNLSRGGYGLYEYVQLIKHYGVELKPRMVIMQVYGGNDLRDAQRYQAYRELSPEERETVQLRAGWEPLKVSYRWLLPNWLGRNSYAYNFLIVAGSAGLSEIQEGIWELTGSKKAIDFRFWVDDPDVPVLMNPGNDQKDEVRTAREAQSGEISFAAFDEALASYAALSREAGFVPVLSYAPAAHVAYGSLVRFEDRDLKALMQWYSRAQRAYFREKCAELGIVFIDLTPALNAEAALHAGSKLLYYPGNIHFTAFGHQVVAQELVRALQAQPLAE